VMVDGHWLLEAGQLVTLDYAGARADLNEAYSELKRRRREEER
jgi:hypothetical protein